MTDKQIINSNQINKHGGVKKEICDNNVVTTFTVTDSIVEITKKSPHWNINKQKINSSILRNWMKHTHCTRQLYVYLYRYTVPGIDLTVLGSYLLPVLGTRQEPEISSFFCKPNIQYLVQV